MQHSESLNLGYGYVALEVFSDKAQGFGFQPQGFSETAVDRRRPESGFSLGLELVRRC